MVKPNKPNDRARPGDRDKDRSLGYKVGHRLATIIWQDPRLAKVVISWPILDEDTRQQILSLGDRT